MTWPKRLTSNTAKLGFELLRGGPTEEHCSLAQSDARLMLEKPASFYSEPHNEAIRQRLGTPSAMALYIEAPDVEELYAKVTTGRLRVVDSRRSALGPARVHGRRSRGQLAHLLAAPGLR